MAANLTGIRKPSQAELPIVVEMLLTQLEEHEMPVSMDLLRQSVETVLSQPEKGLVLVATIEGKIAAVSYLAFIWTLEYGGKTAWLEELYVAPAHREKGVGANLLHATLDAARKAGCQAVDLEVDADHARVESLYARAGFARRNRSRWYLQWSGK